MLSTVQILAAGTTGDEAIQLSVGGATVATFNGLGAGANAGVYQQLAYTTSATVSPNDIRIAFINDLYDQANGIDRNVRIDAIVIDGTRYETEAPNVFSTGTWLNEDGLQPGNRQNEFLHANGYFQYGSGNPNSGSRIQVNAYGSEGTEQFSLRIDGQNVATWSTSTTYASYAYQAQGQVTADRIRIQFLNDQYDPEAGIDANLIVDSIVVDGTTYETEAPNVYSTGTWLVDGLQPGFRQSEVLHSNGYFQYASAVNQGSLVEVRAAGDEGTELFRLLVNDIEVARYNATNSLATYSYRAADNVTADQVRIEFLNDLYDPAAGVDRNLIVDYLAIDGTVYQTEAANVYSTGTWLPADGVQPGYRQSQVLNSNGYFQYTSAALNHGTIGLTISEISIREDIGQLNFVVFRTGGADGRVSVDYRAVGITADGSDFQPVSGTLLFEPGITDGRITVTINDDNLVEAPEQFQFELSNATGGAVLGSAITEVVTIVDNDVASVRYLPDLVTIPGTLAEQIRIDTREQPGRELLRFSTEVANGGAGPLEIYGGATTGTTQQVFQRIYGPNGQFEDRLAGQFVFHAEHGHIHFEGFAEYRLLDVSATERVVATGGKTSFCLVNIRQPFPSVTANAGLIHGRGGNSCGQVQGISTGYSDVYSYSLPDQWIDVTNVADGTYWLEVTADPDNSLVELNENNNSSRIKIRLSNGTVSVLPS